MNETRLLLWSRFLYFNYKEYANKEKGVKREGDFQSKTQKGQSLEVTVKRCVGQTIPPTEQRKEKSKGKDISL